MIDRETLRRAVRPTPHAYAGTYYLSTASWREQCRSVREVFRELDEAHAEIERLVKLADDEYVRGWDDGFKTGQSVQPPPSAVLPGSTLPWSPWGQFETVRWSQPATPTVSNT